MNATLRHPPELASAFAAEERNGLASGEMVAQIGLENASQLPAFAGLIEGPTRGLRGRERQVDLWLLPKDKAPSVAVEVPANRV